MKKQTCLLICMIMLFTTIFSVFPIATQASSSSLELSAVYVCESTPPAEIPKELICADLASATKALTSGGTVYVCGDVAMPAAISATEKADTQTYIKGYPGTNARVTFSASGAEISRNLTFDDITIKGAAKDESWTRVVGSTLTFASGCRYEPSEPYPYGNKTATTGIYIGHSKKAEGDSHYVFSAAPVEYNMIAPVALYSSGYDVKGDFTFDLNNGIFDYVYGGVRNGNSTTNFQRLYGDVTYNINGGQMLYLYTHNHQGGSVYGNLVFNINGGTYSANSKFAFGNSVNMFMSNTLNTGDYTESGNIAFVINADELEKNKSNSSLLKITEATNFENIARGDAMIVINHAEKSGFIPQISVSSIEYLVKINGGRAIPVFEESDNSGNIGEFLGFDIISENKGYLPYVNGKKLTLNKNGYYDLPKSTNGTFVTVVFENPLEDKFFDVNFVNPEDPSDKFTVSVEGNNFITLPACEFESDDCFAGWENDDGIFASGESYVIDKNCTFYASWIDRSLVDTVYVNGETGNDVSSGATKYAPVKTLYQAVVNADSYGATKIVIMSAIDTGNVSFTATETPLIITGRDDDTDYGGSLVFTSTQALRRPVTFEHMALGCEKFQFICSGSDKLVFGDGLVGIEDKGIFVHFGNEYSAASGVDAEIHSGVFSSIFLGGAYLGSEGVGLAGDARLLASDYSGLSVNVGFDGYSPYDHYGYIDGSVELVVDGGSLGTVNSVRVSEIKGSLYVISQNGGIIPLADALPEANNGIYSIRVVSSDGIVRAATDDDGNIRAGYINASCDSPDKVVRITHTSGAEVIHEQGDIALSSGSYTIEFVQKSILEYADIPVDEPVYGHKAYPVHYATEQYTVVGEWYCGDKQIDRFGLNEEYTLVMTLMPNSAVDTSEFYDVSVNGNGTYFEENDNGSFTILYEYGPILTGVERYVSESKGSDSNPGTKEKPYKTLSTAVNVVGKTGGVVYVMDSVNAHLGKNTYPVLISGSGFPDAALYLANNGGSALAGNITFDDIKMTMGSFSHYNDKGYRLTFGDGVSMPAGCMVHLGTYNTASANSVDVRIGKNTSFQTLHLGGGYHSTTPHVKGDVSVYLAGKVTNLSYGTDAYLDKQVAGAVDGNFLFTIDKEGSFSKMILGARRLIVSDDTVFQFVMLNGSEGMGAVPTDLVPLDEIYTIYSGVGGTVLHAKDENGKSITGKFDVIPDKDRIAIIKYKDFMAYTNGGRYTFPANTKVTVSYIKTKYPIESYKVDLAGGAEEGRLFEIDDEGCIHFLVPPVKTDFIFEGWYGDAEYTQLIKDGDFVGKNILLYAKFMSFPMRERDGVFAIRGVQMRVPNSSSNVQGLRFITLLDNEAIEKVADFSDKNSDMLRPKSGYETHYGTVVMPTEILGVSPLTLDGEYVYSGKVYKSRNAAGINLFAQTDDKTEYTVCLLNISPEKYEYAYTARPYIIYYNRSGNLCTLYGKPYSVDVMDTTFAALESGLESSANEKYMREVILPIYAETRNIELLPGEVLDSINEKTEQYKQNVLNSKNMDLSHITGTIYYVSPDGSDSNSGKTQNAPWKTIAKVNATTLKSGDAVLFKRGGEYRGKITATTGVTYSAYGEGAKPIINGCAQNYADPDLWQKTGVENVWKLIPAVSNVGLMAFDHTKQIGVYDELVGTMRVSGASYDGVIFNNQFDLKEDLQFYSNMSNGALYLYSDRGNPGERFKSIELGSGGNLLAVSSKKHVTVDNLDFRYGGSHGVGGSGGLATYNSDGTLKQIGGCADLTVTNCLFSWIGGSILSDTTRFGNAVEIFGSVDGYLVENNWIYQIYDTAITHQLSGTSVGNSHMRDILYKDNLIEYCHWSIEFYNQNCECCASREVPLHSRIVEDVLSEGNIIRMGGYGWGSRIRPDGATLYNSFGLSRVESETRNFHAKDNIFFRCTGGLYRIYANASEDNLTFESNLWVQDYDGILAWFKNSTYRFNNTTKDYIPTTHLKEVDTQGVYFYAP